MLKLHLSTSLDYEPPLAFGVQPHIVMERGLLPFCRAGCAQDGHSRMPEKPFWGISMSQMCHQSRLPITVSCTHPVQPLWSICWKLGGGEASAALAEWWLQLCPRVTPWAEVRRSADASACSKDSTTACPGKSASSRRSGAEPPSQG